MKTRLLVVVAVMICGCTHIVSSTPHTIEITCKPDFELKPRQDMHVMDSEGNQHDAFWQWLILDNGRHKFRIPWGSPPLSRPPVLLYAHQTYTFTVKTEEEQQVVSHEVIRITTGTDITYGAPQ